MAEMEKPLKIVMTADTYNRIYSIAKRDRVSMATVVRDMIDASIDEREKFELPKFGTNLAM